MHNDQSSYSLWSWIVALILAIILLWMLLTGHGPNTSCCSASTEPATAEALCLRKNLQPSRKNLDLLHQQLILLAMVIVQM
jgi:hypothetical protein